MCQRRHGGLPQGAGFGNPGGFAVYTERMTAIDEHAPPLSMLAPAADLPAPVADPVSNLIRVYRDYPGLRALILRRVRDPEVAADILQDAAVTTLEKLRNGQIAHPENIGGYLYRVAINHLRNHRRRDRSALCDTAPIDELADVENDPDWEKVGRPQWAEAARRLLHEMPVARDRDLLMRFYLHDEDKEQICRELRLSEEHFNRVIFRARNRFRELLEHRGFWKADLLSIAALTLYLAASLCGGFTAAAGSREPLDTASRAHLQEAGRC
jgi:RNA polymerase sigma-70 factor, ECF subfamily